MARKHVEFQFMLYQKFQGSRQHSVKDIADKMNIPASTLYHYIEGESTFPPELIGPLYSAMKDPDILNFILKNTDQMIAPRPGAESRKPLLEEVLDVASAAGQLVTTAQQAMKDGVITIAEEKSIDRAIDRAHAELEEMRDAIKKGK